MKRRDAAWPYSEEDDPTSWTEVPSPKSTPASKAAAASQRSPITPAAAGDDEARPGAAPNTATDSTATDSTATAETTATDSTATNATVTVETITTETDGASAQSAEIQSAEIQSAETQSAETQSVRQPARIVAKIIDPAVRGDGRGDPQFSMQPPAGRPAGTARAAGSPHPVRERLLARARSALVANESGDGGTADTAADAGAANTGARERPPAADPWFSKDGEGRAHEPDQPNVPDLGAEHDVADDLDLIGAPERPRPERTPHVAPALPAPTALLLGTLAGLIAIGGLFFALGQLDPRAPLQTPPAPPASEAPQALPESLPEATPEPPPVGRVQRTPRARVPGPWRIADAAQDARFLHVRASMGSHTFLAATQAAGINLRESYRLLGAFEGVKNLDRCRAKDSFTALLDPRSGRVNAFEYTASDEDVYQARESADGKLVGRKLELDVKRHRTQGVVVMDGSFEDSARRAGFEPGLGDYVNKALSGYVSTADMKAGDVLGLVVQEVAVLGDFSRYAGVEALEYRPVSGEPLRIYYQEHDKSRGYVDSKGRVFGKSRWTRPVPGAGVTSRYNPKRMHPILHRIKPHNGTDFGSPVGTPVVAASAGQIAFVGRAGPNGNMITIAHDGGFQTGYSHLSRFVKGLKVGARVEQRQPIGYVGSTGRSTGPHLHFSAKKNGRFIDPETLNLDGLLRLTVDQRLSTDLRRRYDRMLDSLDLPKPHAPAPAQTARAEAPAPAAADNRPLEVEIAAARAAPPKTPAPPVTVAAPAASAALGSTASDTAPSKASAAASSRAATPLPASSNAPPEPRPTSASPLSPRSPVAPEPSPDEPGSASGAPELIQD